MTAETVKANNSNNNKAGVDLQWSGMSYQNTIRERKQEEKDVTC